MNRMKVQIFFKKAESLFWHCPEMAHEFPNDFEPVLERSLNFLCDAEKENA